MLSHERIIANLHSPYMVDSHGSVPSIASDRSCAFRRSVEPYDLPYKHNVGDTVCSSTISLLRKVISHRLALILHGFVGLSPLSFCLTFRCGIVIPAKVPEVRCRFLDMNLFSVSNFVSVTFFLLDLRWGECNLPPIRNSSVPRRI